MTKLTTDSRTAPSVSEFFDKGFLDNTEEMTKLAKVTGRTNGLDARLHLGEAEDTKQNQDYTSQSNRFSFQGILHTEKAESFEFRSKFSGPDFLESKEHREVMKDVYKSQFKGQDDSAGNREWIQHKLRSLDIDECSASSVKTFPNRTSSSLTRGAGPSRRRTSIPHHLEPLHLQESRKFSARRGSLPLYHMSNSTFQGPAANGTNKLSFSLPRIKESAVVGRQSSPLTEMSENDTESSISEVYRNISGKKPKQSATMRRRSTSFDFLMRKEPELEKKKVKQKWRILIHRRKSLFKDEIHFEPKLNRAKLPSTKLPRLTR